jgi:hypothetical protein
MDLYVRAALLFVLAAHGLCYAQGHRAEPIRFSYLKPVSPNENSAISGECDGDTSSPKITCRVTQLLVRYQLDPSKLDAETEKRLSRLREELKKDPSKFTEKLCSDIRKNTPAIEEKMKGSKNSRAFLELQEYMRLCADPTMKNIEDWLR